MDPRIFALICVVLGGMGQGVVAPKMPELIRNAESLAFTSGLSATLMYLGIFVSTFRYGRWADKGKFHWLLGPGLLAYSVCLILMGLFQSATPILILRFFEGLTLSAIYVAADFALGRLSPPEHRGQWLSYYGVAISVGLILGPLVALASGTVAKSFGVSPELADSAIFPLGFVACLALLLGLFAFRIRIPEISDTKTDKLQMNRAALGTGVAYGYMEAALVALFPILSVQEFQVKPEFCLITVIFVAAIASVAWGILSDRIGPRPTILSLVWLLALGPATLILVPTFFAPVIVAYVSCVVFGILAGGLYPVGFAWLLQDLPEANYGYASGAYARMYGLGSLVGPFLAGVVVDKIGARGLFGAIALAGFIYLSLLSKIEKEKKSTTVELRKSA